MTTDSRDTPRNEDLARLDYYCERLALKPYSQLERELAQARAAAFEEAAKICDAESYRHEEFLALHMRGDKVAAFHKSVTAHALAAAIRAAGGAKL